MIDSITRSELILSFVDERHRLRIRERKMAGFSTRKPTLPLRILTSVGGVLIKVGTLLKARGHFEHTLPAAAIRMEVK